MQAIGKAKGDERMNEACLDLQKAGRWLTAKVVAPCRSMSSCRCQKGKVSLSSAKRQSRCDAGLSRPNSGKCHIIR